MRKIQQVLRWNALEGEGQAYHNLFYYLWVSDESADQATLGVRIPETVIIKKGKVEQVLYCDDHGRVNKNDEVKTVADVKSLFRGRSKVTQQTTTVAALFLGLPDRDKNVAVQYLSWTELDRFLEQRLLPEGILQRFIAPNGQYNVTLQANWSPSFFSMEKFTSLLRISDRSRTANEISADANTGRNWESTPVVGNPLLLKRVEKVCSNLAMQIQRVAPGGEKKVASCTLHLKNDTEGRLWLLWCSDMSFTDDLQAFKTKKPSSSAAAAEGEERSEDGASQDGAAKSARARARASANDDDSGVARARKMSARYRAKMSQARGTAAGARSAIFPDGAPATSPVPEDSPVRLPHLYSAGSVGTGSIFNETESQRRKVRERYPMPAGSFSQRKRAGEALRLSLVMRASEKSKQRALSNRSVAPLSMHNLPELLRGMSPVTRAVCMGGMDVTLEELEVLAGKEAAAAEQKPRSTKRTISQRPPRIVSGRLPPIHRSPGSRIDASALRSESTPPVLLL